MTTEHRTILIADDRDQFAALMAAFIRIDPRFEVVVVKDGLAALDRASELRPIACVFASGLGPHGGAAVAELIRDALEPRSPLMIAVASGEPSEVIASNAFEHVLARPVDLARLLALVTTVVDRDIPDRH